MGNRYHRKHGTSGNDIRFQAVTSLASNETSSSCQLDPWHNHRSLEECIVTNPAEIQTIENMNVAVGGDWPGNPDATTVFPQQMLVGYVRVYQRAK